MQQAGFLKIKFEASTQKKNEGSLEIKGGGISKRGAFICFYNIIFSFNVN